MTRILCLETASTNCSVALSVDGSVAAFKEDNGRNYSHSESLHVFIEQMLDQAGVSLSELGAIAVSKGPGSYTGLRIGVSAAKGLCFSLDIPLIAIPTLDNLAMQVDAEGLIVPMLDARRMEVYTAVYDQDHQILEPTRAQVLGGDSFSDQLEKGKMTFLGGGAVKFKEICEHPNAVFNTELQPSARAMASKAQKFFDSERFEDVAYFEPYYLKDFMPG
ncbi:tRNA (adenosine(37)-N6)-threonylcarbamoyltransferase complex dimerization subunit type 1 TsaB [Aureitalea marina]|uniref:tRNA (Adenosine(37)-N6)-threonylcarbamoyltransferase complex dimerization subunit type 1 TsaB n=1 Tax=Aureitalea marina TaxID=930804 RepID=A0A2S7KR75_9FLAO|nr:tRNA (adenosine(37)-N6)-threonylcarbamoyltransferase complex dimerization subunit type 1 TsaB [Aureitalea marina]PQB05129.1 tRNA (adenosine(37)-N6)-threonylcarbamoyltransferase complex dimerization subunit type 1 TsaB [Aureitalea marina]